MSIPSAVESILNENEVRYNLTETPSFGNVPAPITQFLNWAGATRSVILKDRKGMLQAIIPVDCMLDLALLNQVTGRELRAISDAELLELIEKKSLRSLPALPQITGLPTVVDEAVFAHPEVLLESGGETGFLRLQQQDFRHMVRGTVIGDISAPIPSVRHASPEQDAESIAQAVGQFTSKRIQQRLEDTLELPPLPETAQRIIRLRVKPDSDIKELSDIVEIDPSLAAQVVSWAASPYYAAPGKIKSVHDAIVRVLGFDLVMNLALGLALGKTLKIPDDQARGFSSYWHQAVYTAATVEELVKLIPAQSRPHMGMACLSGLLHNFGYLILAEVFPPYFSSICRLQEANPHIGHNALEHHLIGIDRDQLSAWLMNLWTMPDEVIMALRHQNNPNYDGDNASYANLLFLATRLLKQHGIGDAPLEEIPAAILERLELSMDDVLLAAENVVACAEEIQSIASAMSE